MLLYGGSKAVKESFFKHDPSKKIVTRNFIPAIFAE